MSENQNFKNKALDSPEEINFKYLFEIIWKNKIFIFFISFFAFIAISFYVLSLPTYYKATGTYTSASEDNVTSAGPLSGLGFGGLSLGSYGNRKLDLAFTTIKSRKFLKDFIIKRDLASKLGLEMTKEKILSLSSHDQDQLMLSFAGKLSRSIGWYRGKADPAFTFWITHPSPTTSKQLVDWIIEDINKVIKERDVDEARKSIEYLQLQASKTSVGELRKLFYSMIENHTTTIMLSEVKEEYVIKTMDPPVLPLRPSNTAKNKLLIWGAIGSLLSGMILVSFLYFFGYELRFKKPYKIIIAKID